jgi:hypothetical protein
MKKINKNRRLRLSKISAAQCEIENALLDLGPPTQNQYAYKSLYYLIWLAKKSK